MAIRKGFTLMEVIVVMVIIGVAAAFALPNYINSIQQQKAVQAQNNLMAIAAGESKYYEDHGAYYFSSSSNDLSNINSNLSLSLASNNGFLYTCYSVGSGYACSANNNAGSINDYIMLQISSQNSNINCEASNTAFCPSGTATTQI